LEASPIDFFDQIKSELEEMSQRAQAEKWPDPQWTIGVKDVIVKIGKRNGYLTAANQVQSDEGKEWLYDVVWYQSDKAGHLTDVPLIAESEWGNSNKVKEDFEKLLVSRSKYRIIVFQTMDKNVSSLIKDMKLWIFKFLRSAAGDRYLFAGWDIDHWIFEEFTNS
jgi:hypothetical protein